MGFVWVTTIGNARQQQIEAGRAYMRVALQATADGLVMQPMSQALQEYQAMAEFYETVHNRLTRGDEERVQMLARLGYAKDEGPAPRWPLASRLLRA
jgi:nitroreductase